MRLSIDHRTVYRFTEPQARLVQMLRVNPQNSHDQTVASWRIDVDHDARMREGRDGFGNAVTMLYVDGPVEAIEIAVQGEVVTSHSDGVLHGVHEPLPPAVFQRSTPKTAIDETLAAFARDATKGAEPQRALHRLNATVKEGFAVERGRGQPGVTAAATMARRSGTARDLAHVFVAGARSLGIPARYVSGYRLGGGAHRPAPHGWAEAWCEDIGWIGFDPCTGLSPEDGYVRVAIGLDSISAAPVAGSRLGEGEEELDVDVTVLREE